MVIGLDFGEPVFMHAILHTSDDRNAFKAYLQKQLKYFFLKYEIYIGDNADYS